MSLDRPASTLSMQQRSLSQAWIDACHRDTALPEPLALDAAAEFLQVMAAALQEPVPEDDRDFNAACRAFDWASGSGEHAVRQLASLRVAIHQVLGDRFAIGT